jgi:hypothetical protein
MERELFTLYPIPQNHRKEFLMEHFINDHRYTRLMNIIRAVPGKSGAINDFKNGYTLFEKHGVSTEQIAEVSFQCQQKFGIQKGPLGSISDQRRQCALFLFVLTFCHLYNQEKLIKRKSTNAIYTAP